MLNMGSSYFPQELAATQDALELLVKLNLPIASVKARQTLNYLNKVSSRIDDPKFLNYLTRKMASNLEKIQDQVDEAVLLLTRFCPPWQYGPKSGLGRSMN